MSRKWIKKTCKFCTKVLDDSFMPECDCPGWVAAQAEHDAKWKEEHKNDPPELSKEEFLLKHPIIYNRKVWFRYPKTPATGDCIGLDTQKFDDGIGLCVYIPFWDEKAKEWENSGLCFDFPEEALTALEEMIKEAQEAIKVFKEK